MGCKTYEETIFQNAINSLKKILCYAFGVTICILPYMMLPENQYKPRVEFTAIFSLLVFVNQIFDGRSTTLNNMIVPIDKYFPFIFLVFIQAGSIAFGYGKWCFEYTPYLSQEECVDFSSYMCSELVVCSKYCITSYRSCYNDLFSVCRNENQLGHDANIPYLSKSAYYILIDILFALCFTNLDLIKPKLINFIQNISSRNILLGLPIIGLLLTIYFTDNIKYLY